MRGLAVQDGEVWVVTGPGFSPPGQRLKGRVLVPATTWKAVYDPKLGAAAYIAPNDDQGSYQIVAISVLIKDVGFDPFPALPDAVKAVRADLPPPDPKSIHRPAAH